MLFLQVLISRKLYQTSLGVNLEFINIVNPYTGVTSQADVLCEFKDDIVEILIDETVRILAGDIENFNQMQRSKQSADENN